MCLCVLLQSSRCSLLECLVSFFLQAQYGIRDRNVTGVQTCALPILLITPVINSTRRTTAPVAAISIFRRAGAGDSSAVSGDKATVRISLGILSGRYSSAASGSRSEERRVGQACATR